MSENTPNSEPSAEEDFQEASKLPHTSLFVEFLQFIKHEKKWWLTPIVLVLLLLALLSLFTSSPVAPFIYTFF